MQLRLWYENLAEAMDAAGMDTEDLAKALGVHTRSVRRWRAEGIPDARASDVQSALGLESSIGTPTFELAVTGLAWRRLGDGLLVQAVPGEDTPSGYELVYLD